jgi:ketosteroid isomerase-like protein
MVTKWHEAMSTKNMDLAMSLFADDAVMTIAGKSLSGREEIRKFLSTQAAPLKPENHWTSLTHTPNIRHSVSGDRGTLFFECHYFDTGTRQLVNSVSGDARVVRRGQGWFFTNLAGGGATLG